MTCKDAKEIWPMTTSLHEGPRPLRSGRPRRRWWTRLAADRSGVAALEFAVLALPLTLILSGTVELGIVNLDAVLLDGATREAARQIRTGQDQQSADPLAAFRTKLCNELSGMLDCAQVLFDVRTFPSFSTVSVPPLHDAAGNPITPAFDPGEPGKIVVVRSTLRWTYQTPLLAQVLGTHHDVSSTQIFRNEPYKGPL